MVFSYQRLIKLFNWRDEVTRKIEPPETEGTDEEAFASENFGNYYSSFQAKYHQNQKNRGKFSNFPQTGLDTLRNIEDLKTNNTTFSHISNKDSSLSSDEIQKNEFRPFSSSKKKVLGSKYLRFLPITYFICQISILVILVFINSNEAKSQSSLSYFVSDQYSDYFYLMSISKGTKIASTAISAVISLLIAIIIFSILKQRFNVPEYKLYNYRLYVMLALGVFTSLFELLNGYYPFYYNLHLNEERLNSQIFLFVLFTATSMLYAANIVFNLLTLRQSQILSEQEENWFAFKVIILAFSLVFAFLYTTALLQLKQVLWLDVAIFLRNLDYILKFYPFFIHIMIGVLNLSYYFDIRYCSVSLTRNLEVDYLFDDQEFLFDKDNQV